MIYNLYSTIDHRKSGIEYGIQRPPTFCVQEQLSGLRPAPVAVALWVQNPGQRCLGGRREAGLAMLYCLIPRCSIIFYILFYTILCDIILYYARLYYIRLCYMNRYCSMLDYTIRYLYYTILYCIIVYYTILIIRNPTE